MEVDGVRIPDLDETTQLLVMCSTRQRPHRIAEMLESFDKTHSPGTEMVIYVADSDPYISDYEKVLSGRKVIYGPDKGYLVNVLNWISTVAYPDMKYYAEVNDDHVYKTVGWDAKFIESIETRGNGWGLACGQDLVDPSWHHYRHPSAVMLSGNIVRALGCFTYPKLKHCGSDDYHRDIGDCLGRLFFHEGVVIEHRCWHVANKSPQDAVAFAAYQTQSEGQDVYTEWSKTQKALDCEKLNEAMKLDGVL